MKLTGKGAGVVKAIATASNRYLAGEISMKGLRATINLWGNVALKVNGQWARSSMYSFANAGISSLLSGWY